MAAESADDESEPLPQPVDERLETILDLPGELHKRLVATASRLIRECRLDPAGVQAEGAVNLAQLRLWKAVKAGRYPELATRKDLEKALTVILDRFLRDRRKHQRRRKRAAPTAPVDAEIGVPDPHAIPPDEQVGAQEQFEWDLALLERSDPQLREIALWKMEGLTNTQIAARLKTSVATVGRRLKQIRSILGRLRSEDA